MPAVDPPTINLDAYFARIGFAGPREPTLPVLRSIVFHHATSVPFENLSILLRHGVPLDADSLQKKIVADRRGGYCFEQNGLLLRVLGALGYSVTPLSARVRLQQPRDFIPARTHLFTRVVIDGTPWLADVGVGGLTPTAPLRLDTAEPQSTPHCTHRIVPEDGRFFHQALLKEGWSDVYEFTGEAMPEIDREVASWWTSTNPDSKFRKNLMLALARPDGTRLGVQNRSFFTRGRDGEITETREIADADELLAVLDRRFGLTFAPGTRFGPPGSDWPT